jgi:uncharacterized protein (TIGR02118 family)
VTVLYPSPADPAAFDDYYDRVHMLVARRMRGLVRWTIQRVDHGTAPPPGYHMVVQLSAPTRQALEAVLASPEGRAASDDVANFATGGAIFLYGRQDDVDLGAPVY